MTNASLTRIVVEPTISHFRNCENVGGMERDHLRRRPASLRPASDKVKCPAPTPSALDGDREVVMLDCKT